MMSNDQKTPAKVGLGERCNPTVSPKYQTHCKEGLVCKTPKGLLGASGVCVKADDNDDLPTMKINRKRSNMSFENCDYNNDWYCARNPFSCTSVGPDSCGRAEVTVLNPDLYKNNVAQDFIRVDDRTCDGLLGHGYTSEDARLKNPRTGNIPIELDKRPMDMGIKTLDDEEIYTSNCKDWKTGFTNYEDMNKGQITYYVDQEIAAPFTHPIFENKAAVMGYVNVTPMNTINPEYERRPLKCRNCLETNLCRCDYLGGLSWIEDSNEHREDLISRQLWNRNRSKWQSRWDS